MSGTSARESYRSGKRTRPSDSQSSRMTPPVLFRLPSVSVPGMDPQSSASNVNAAAMAMPMAAAATLPMGSVGTATVPAPGPAVTETLSAPASAAVATTATEKAAGQRMLNMMIVVLLVAALVVILWISMNRSTPPASLAQTTPTNDATLDSLGELKVPVVSTQPDSSPSKAAGQGLAADEIQPNNDGSLIDLPVATAQPSSPTATEKESASESLLSLDPSGIDASLASQPNGSTNTENTATAQIQLRTPVPVGGNTSTSLVDAQRPTSQLSPSSGSSSSARVDTVSAPTQPIKIFPANTDPARAGSSSSAPSSADSSTLNSGSTSSNPQSWDTNQAAQADTLQLSQNVEKQAVPTGANAGSSAVSISSPLTKDVSMNSSTLASNSPTQRDLPTGSDQGVTVGGGAEAPYTLKQSSTLKGSRPDLDPVMLAKVAVSGLANRNTTANSPTTQPINSYVGALGTQVPNQNLYQNSPNQSLASSGPINSYVAGNVPAGTTGNGPGPYLPPTGTTVNQYSGSQLAVNPYAASANQPNQLQPNQFQPNQFQSNQFQQNQFAQTQNPQFTNAQLTSGPTSVPATAAGFNLPPRGTTTNFGQPGVTQQPVNAPQRPNQPGTNAYGTMGSGYGNPTYATPSAGTTMPRAGFQPAASYPTTNAFPGGQVPAGMIGPIGNATAPSGDIAPRPVMGQAGGATAFPYGPPQ